MIPLGIMFGLTVRMGTVLARGDVHRAKLIAMWSMLLIVVLGAIVSLSLYHFCIPIVKLFTIDQRVIQGCEDIWLKMCIYVFVLYIFGINSAIMRALGLQWRMAAIIFLCLWCGTLPTIAYFAVRRGGQLDAVWTILPFFYTIMQVLLIWSYTTADWNKIGEEARYRLSMRVDKDLIAVTEDTPLL
jgi:Na+-driven multidrug efflux pump